jgi:hypothetical protein
MQKESSEGTAFLSVLSLDLGAVRLHAQCCMGARLSRMMINKYILILMLIQPCWAGKPTHRAPLLKQNVPTCRCIL